MSRSSAQPAWKCCSLDDVGFVAIDGVVLVVIDGRGGVGVVAVDGGVAIDGVVVFVVFGGVVTDGLVVALGVVALGALVSITLGAGAVDRVPCVPVTLVDVDVGGRVVVAIG